MAPCKLHLSNKTGHFAGTKDFCINVVPMREGNLEEYESNVAHAHHKKGHFKSDLRC